jgi:hypothetical protein
MKKNLFLAFALLISSTSYAATDHYILRDGSHVQHLKISTVGGETRVSSDVDFEPNTTETGRHACSAQVAGDAKFVSDTELVMKKHIEGEAKICSLKITLTANGAKVEQSEECGYFAAGLCHFTSEGKELLKIK